MDLEKIIAERYSCRRFQDRQVPVATIDSILTLAQRTPSWCNTQPWHVMLLSGTATDRFRAAMYEHAAAGLPINPDFQFPAKYEGIYRERRKVCGVQLYQALGIGREEKVAAAEQGLENFRLFGAPHVALITTEAELGVYGAVDCGLYVANFMFAAHNVGVASIAQAALASYPDFIRDYFGLPSHRRMVCGVSFGFEDETHPINHYRTARAAVSESVSRLD